MTMRFLSLNFLLKSSTITFISLFTFDSLLFSYRNLNSFLCRYYCFLQHLEFLFHNNDIYLIILISFNLISNFYLMIMTFSPWKL